MIYIRREREKQSKIYKTNSMVEESQKNEKGVPKEEDLDQCGGGGAAASYVQKKFPKKSQNQWSFLINDHIVLIRGPSKL